MTAPATPRASRLALHLVRSTRLIKDVREIDLFQPLARGSRPNSVSENPFSALSPSDSSLGGMSSSPGSSSPSFASSPASDSEVGGPEPVQWMASGRPAPPSRPPKNTVRVRAIRIFSRKKH
eukprot:GABV01014390.1.p1 GENE.GABV01014390.1~~GABV01014390.1.p1  ORF type:complete len:122 (-),score=14.62 GABV01014390.1:11-376(-)